MAYIAVSFGTFNVEKNEGSKGCKVMTLEGTPVWNMPNVEWWDKDGIIHNLEVNKRKITENIHKKKCL